MLFFNAYSICPSTYIGLYVFQDAKYVCPSDIIGFVDKTVAVVYLCSSKLVSEGPILLLLPRRLCMLIMQNVPNIFSPCTVTSS